MKTLRYLLLLVLLLISALAPAALAQDDPDYDPDANPPHWWWQETHGWREPYQDCPRYAEGPELQGITDPALPWPTIEFAGCTYSLSWTNIPSYYEGTHHWLDTSWDPNNPEYEEPVIHRPSIVEAPIRNISEIMLDEEEEDDQYDDGSFEVKDWGEGFWILEYTLPRWQGEDIWYFEIGPDGQVETGHCGYYNAETGESFTDGCQPLFRDPDVFDEYVEEEAE